MPMNAAVERPGSARSSATNSGLPNDVSSRQLRTCGSWKYKRLAAVLTVGLGYWINASVASATETASSPLQPGMFPVAQIFTFLFLMLGPFKIIGPFSKLTKGADPDLARQIALLSILFSSLALLFAAFLGEVLLSKYNIPLPILALAVGIILFLVALQNIVQQFAPPTSHSEEPASPTPTKNIALTPLAFPTIVTPYGIGALVVFLAFAPDTQSRLTIGAIVLAIMLLNLLAMIFARKISSILGVALAIIGAVLGIVQVALGLQIINNSLKALGAG